MQFNDIAMSETAIQVPCELVTVVTDSLGRAHSLIGGVANPSERRSGPSWRIAHRRCGFDDRERHARAPGDNRMGLKSLRCTHDRLRATYSERSVQFDLGLDQRVTIDRRATGAISGEYLFDPFVRLFSLSNRHNQPLWNGTLTYLDGRSFAVPTTFERVRQMVRWDSTAIGRPAIAGLGYGHRRPEVVSSRSCRIRRGSAPVAAASKGSRASAGPSRGPCSCRARDTALS